jgi:hypothetical protein
LSEQIVIGQLIEPTWIKPKDKPSIDIDEWDMRAMWSFLRLQFGRSIDRQIRDYVMQQQVKAKRKFSKPERSEAVKDFFNRQVAEIQKPREIQFIMSGSTVMAVASLQHLLIPPAKVYSMAAQIVQKKYPSFTVAQVSELAGATYEVKEEAGFKTGLQVFGGDIFTRQAITVTSWLRVEQCFNPLSWLGMGFFGYLGFSGRGNGDFERVLRIKVISDLKPRLKAGIEAALQKQNTIDDRIKQAQKVKVKRSEAEIIMAAMGLSYDLGVPTVEQILERLEKEKKTQWGMSMASSWVAAHGKFKETPEGQNRKVEQKLSTISGAAVLLGDIKEAEERSLEWLQAHVKQGEIKRLDDLMQELGINKKVKKQ